MIDDLVLLSAKGRIAENRLQQIERASLSTLAGRYCI